MGRILLKHVMNKLNYVEYKFYNSLAFNSWFWSDFHGSWRDENDKHLALQSEGWVNEH